MQTHLYSHERGDYFPLPEVPAKYAPVVDAFLQYVARDLRREHPDGSFDKNSLRWYPSDSERQECCAGIRQPSRKWPYSLMLHCRSAGHIAALHGIEAKLLRGLIAWIVRYYQAAPTAPIGLCRVCGADWACEHKPQLVGEAELAGMKDVTNFRYSQSEIDSLRTRVQQAC